MDYPASHQLDSTLCRHSSRVALDPLHRRDLLRVGSLSVAATALASCGDSLTGASSAAAESRSVIYLWMGGGVTHIDSFDPKPNAPVEIRGDLETIATSIPGEHFSETIPHLAEIANQLAVVRSYSHDSNDHLLSQVFTLTGRKVDQSHLFTEPNIGSVVSHVFGPRRGLPAYVAVPGITRPGPPPHNFFLGGWLGSQHAPYCLGGIPEQPDFTVGEKEDHPSAFADEDWTPTSLNLSRRQLERLVGRTRLRNQLDIALRRLEKSEKLLSAETKYRDALRLLQNPTIRSAFAIGDEPDAIREEYGRAKIGGRCLLARRLVEAGARFVMVDYGYDSDYGNVWDNHNAPSQKHPPIQQMVKRGYHLAGMDRAFAALIRDLSRRGRLQQTLVVFLTEFGRTPRINARGGRDHWGAAGSLFFAGAGVKAGQVIGATDGHAAAPISTGYSPADIAATIYSALGIQPNAMIKDFQGRPRLVLEQGRVIPGLL